MYKRASQRTLDNCGQINVVKKPKTLYHHINRNKEERTPLSRALKSNFLYG